MAFILAFLSFVSQNIKNALILLVIGAVLGLLVLMAVSHIPLVGTVLKFILSL